MRELRVPLSDVRPGEYVVRIGTRDISARFVALHDCPIGMSVRGPRGGSYRLTAHGAHERVVVETYAGRPLVARDAVAVVLRDDAEAVAR